MKKLGVSLATVILAATALFSSNYENLINKSAQAFNSAIPFHLLYPGSIEQDANPVIPITADARQKRTVEDVFREVLPQDPENSVKDTLLGKDDLNTRLDRHLRVMKLKLGDKNYFVSVGMVSSSEEKYIVILGVDFPKTIITELDLDKIRKRSGIEIKIDNATTYRVRLKVNYLDPIENSTFYMEPVGSTRGPKHSFKSGKLLDMVRDNSYVFRTRNGREFWMIYATDIDSKTKTFAKTRSVGFIQEAGMDTQMYHLPEAKLPQDKLVDLSLGGTVIRLLKNAANILSIYE
ncbi:hypothetical protein ACFL6Y_10275 [Elusimicrobiota bacterium]